MSKRKSGRNVHGILLLDKRLGVSSNRALQEVRHLFNANKAGHTGSLDPLATGLLPLCFGEATKVSALMLDDNKRYQVLVQLGVMTDTGDAEGIVIETKPVPALSVEEVQACLQKFTGEIDQIPPMYSALKHNGKKLYELAREGITIERKARRIRIFELKLLTGSQAGAWEPDSLTLEVFCSKGTYIRSLAEDIGHTLGCGGTVKALRRLEAGLFSIEQARTIEQLTAMSEQDLFQCLIAVDKPLEALPSVQLSDEQAISIKYGQSINLPGTPDSSLETWQGTVRMYHNAIFLGLGEMLLDGKIAPKKLFNMSND
ncbi:MAG: tRNA pseudouridine(55) synthase TruB [Methylococcaceae bacterium]|jgi:tRNA pseudouridine55 synthase|nr:tRNA pseudouridine(55) synthase TruB [Methylococcaceae bacterium]MDD1644447.1 tRNA pseudouridine(55) synthase TruB [Methylococcaceae bacterium]OYV17998.1 MAG: tRNA pseudouridine55 synthase [Methylococcaceae bacterium NSM2-1]